MKNESHIGGMEEMRIVYNKEGDEESISYTSGHTQ
jgi:hypothetical protein